VELRARLHSAGRNDRTAALPTRAGPELVRALAPAFRYLRPLDEGRYASISGMAAADRIEHGCPGSLHLPRQPADAAALARRACGEPDAHAALANVTQPPAARGAMTAWPTDV
jgi:hypothetical protein